MGKKIVDNFVKMDWEASGAVFMSSKGKKNRVFVYASKVYDTVVGEITVFFTAHTAFLWADDAGTEDEDLYNASDLKGQLGEVLDNGFPDLYTNYIPIIRSGESTCVAENIEKYGLAEFEDDIIARLEDVSVYGIERDTP